MTQQDILRSKGVSVWLSYFPAPGWDSAHENWFESVTHESLAEFVRRVTQLPDHEASAIANSTLREWRERDGEHIDLVGGRRFQAGFLAFVALALVGLVAVLFLLLVGLYD